MGVVPHPPSREAWPVFDGRPCLHARGLPIHAPTSAVVPRRLHGAVLVSFDIASTFTTTRVFVATFRVPLASHPPSDVDPPRPNRTSQPSFPPDGPRCITTLIPLAGLYGLSRWWTVGPREEISIG